MELSNVVTSNFIGIQRSDRLQLTVRKLIAIINLCGVFTILYLDLLDVVFRSFLIFYYIVCFYRSQRECCLYRSKQWRILCVSVLFTAPRTLAMLFRDNNFHWNENWTCKESGNGKINGNNHPIRTLYPNKIIVSNKLLGLLGLGSGLEFGSGLILYAWNDNSSNYWNYQTL